MNYTNEDFITVKETLVSEKSSSRESESKIQDTHLQEAMNQFLYASSIEGKAEKTLEQYDYVFRKFKDFLEEDFLLSSISPNMIRQFLYQLNENGLSKATVAIHYRVLRAFFNWLIGEGLLENSPMKNISEPKTPKKYPRILNRNQVDKLLRAAKNRSNAWAGYRNYTITTCFLDMGLRLNELICASLKDLNFEERTLKVHGKGAKDRIVFFGFETYKRLKEWMKIRNKKNEPKDKTIFISQTGEKLKARYVEHIISDLQKEAGLEDIKVSPHVLRHTAATLAVKNGMGTFPLKRFFGWESVRTAIKYVHLDGSTVKESFTKASPIDNLNRNK